MPPEPRKRIFIASASESLPIAEAIRQQIERHVYAEVWTDGTFRPADHYTDSLERKVETADCGVFILAPIDIVESRNVAQHAPRDNVIFELGLFVGALGLKRSVIVHPRDPRPKLPSDLSGVVTLDYDAAGITSPSYSDLRVAVAPACGRLIEHIDTLDARSLYISWQKTCELTQQLAGRLRAKPRHGGYSFNFIVGISHGGMVVADLLSAILHDKPAVCLWADCGDDDCNEYNFEPPANWVNGPLFDLLRDPRVRNILVVDDVADRGVTLQRAKEAIEAATSKRVKTAALLSHAGIEVPVDYSGMVVDRHTQTPFHLIYK